MTDQNLDSNDQSSENQNGNPPANGDKAKTFTQAELDRIVKDRLDREKVASKARVDALQAELESYKLSAEKYEERIGKFIADAAKDLPQSVLSIFDKLDTADKLEWLEENANNLPIKKAVRPVPDGSVPERGDDIDEHIKVNPIYSV